MSLLILLASLIFISSGSSFDFSHVESSNHLICTSGIQEECTLTLSGLSEYASYITLECPSDASCTIECVNQADCDQLTINADSTPSVIIKSNYGILRDAKIYTNLVKSVSVICNANQTINEVCNGLSLYTNQINTLDITCNGDLACDSINIQSLFDTETSSCSYTNEFILNCNGDYSCPGLNMQLMSTKDAYESSDDNCLISPSITCNGFYSCENSNIMLLVSGDLNMNCNGDTSCQYVTIDYEPYMYNEYIFSLICNGKGSCSNTNIMSVTSSEIDIECIKDSTSTTTTIFNEQEVPCQDMQIIGPILPFDQSQLYSKDTLHNGITLDCGGKWGCFQIFIYATIGYGMININNFGETCGDYNNDDDYDPINDCFRTRAGWSLNAHVYYDDVVDDATDYILEQLDGINVKILGTYDDSDTITTSNGQNVYYYGLRNVGCVYTGNEDDWYWFDINSYSCPKRTIECGNQNVTFIPLQSFSFANNTISAEYNELLTITMPFDNTEFTFVESNINAPNDGYLYIVPKWSDYTFSKGIIDATSVKVFYAEDVYQSFDNTVIILNEAKDVRWDCDQCNNIQIYTINTERNINDELGFIDYTSLCIECEDGSNPDDSENEYKDFCINITIWVDDGDGDIRYCTTSYDMTAKRFYCYLDGDTDGTKYLLNDRDLLDDEGEYDSSVCDINDAVYQLLGGYGDSLPGNSDTDTATTTVIYFGSPPTCGNYFRTSQGYLPPIKDYCYGDEDDDGGISYEVYCDNDDLDITFYDGTTDCSGSSTKLDADNAQLTYSCSKDVDKCSYVTYTLISYDFDSDDYYNTTVDPCDDTMFTSEFLQSALILDTCFAFTKYECDYETNAISVNIYEEQGCDNLQTTLVYQADQCSDDGIYFTDIQCNEYIGNGESDNATYLSSCIAFVHIAFLGLFVM